MKEREWTDKFGSHYEASAFGADGRVHKCKVTKLGHLGWPKKREEARAVVVASPAKEPTP